jgi:hypothetical protein
MDEGCAVARHIMVEALREGGAMVVNASVVDTVCPNIRSEVDPMITLYLRYTIDPNKLSDFAAYITEEQIPIRRAAARSLDIICPPISLERPARRSV